MNDKKISTVLGSVIVSTRNNYDITYGQFEIFLDSERISSTAGGTGKAEFFGFHFPSRSVLNNGKPKKKTLTFTQKRKFLTRLFFFITVPPHYDTEAAYPGTCGFFFCIYFEPRVNLPLRNFSRKQTIVKLVSGKLSLNRKSIVRFDG